MRIRTWAVVAVLVFVVLGLSASASAQTASSTTSSTADSGYGLTGGAVSAASGSNGGTSTLPTTGSNPFPLAAVGCAAVVVGSLLVLVRRRWSDASVPQSP